MQNVRQWLEQVGLQQYGEAFEHNAIEIDLVCELTDADLEKLGVLALGHRKRLLKAIEAARGARTSLSARAPDSYTPTHLAQKILTSKTSLEGERKQVTVLFADLKGSMELLADRDPEAARRLLDPILERMMEAVHHYEGTVNQVMGDGIMALFGAPIAHEDHAVRACYAALRMQESVMQYSGELRRTEAVSVEIRVGLNSGEVLVRAIGSDLRMDYTAVGQTTHLAARMEHLARSGSTLLTASTLRLAEGYVRVASIGLIGVKGLAEAVEAHELIGVGTARTRLQAAALRGLTRFVGRAAEIEHLRRVMGQAGAGRGQVVGIVGEAGVGKSRLVYEFTHSHRAENWLILEAPSVSYGKATGYLPVIGLLKSYFKIGERDDHREMREKITGKLLTLNESLRPLLPAFFALLDLPIEDPNWEALDPPQRRQRTLDAVKRLLLRESQVQPMLLVFEDLHWIDAETQALLEGLVESVGSANLLLVVSYRPEYDHRWGRKTAYSHLRLDSLPAESAAELLAALLGPDPSLAPLMRVLVKRGNPFFLEETVRTLVETGALVGERGAYQLTRSVAELQVPTTVQTMLEARIDRLPQEQKQLLQAAAVIGKDLPYALISAIVDQPNETLRRGLIHLQEAEFLLETQIFPDLEYSFKHALTHEVAYRSLLRDRRRQLHAQIVLTSEELYADRLSEHVERLAHHALRGQVWDRAIGYCRRAGVRALDRSAAREALDHFAGAREAIKEVTESPDRTGQFIDLCFDQRNALFALGEFAEMGNVISEARTQAEGLGDQRKLGWALAYAAHRHSFLGEHLQAIGAGENALSIADVAGDVGLRVVANYYLGQAFWFAGDPRRGGPPLTAAIGLIKSVLPGESFGMTALSAVVTRWAAAENLAERGEFVEAVAAGKEGLRIAQTSAHRPSEIYARYGLGYAHLRQGDFTSAKDILEPSLALCRELEIRVALPFVAATLGSVYLRSNRIADAVPLLQEALQAFSAMAITGLLSLAMTFLADAHLVLGDVDEARKQAEKAVLLAHAQQERGWEAWGLKLLGDVFVHESTELKRAAEIYGHALALATELEMRPLVAHCHMGLGGAHAKAGFRTEAIEQLNSGVTLYREMGMGFWLETAQMALNEVRIS